MRPQAVPLEVDEAVTGKYDGPELEIRRARRTTARRLEILEGKHDTLVADVAQVRADTGKIVGTVDALFKMTAADHEARSAREQAEAKERASKRSLVVPTIRALGIAIAVIVAAALGYYGG